MDTWDRSQHVSRWPSYDLKEEPPRGLAAWDEIHDITVTSDGEVIYFTTWQQWKKEVTERRLIIFCHRITDLPFFDELRQRAKVKGGGVKIYVTRTNHISGVYIKSKFSAWIIERRVWDDGYAPPDADFLRTMQDVFKVNGRYAPTPGSLGEKKIRETLPIGTRYSRPSVMLRNRMLSNKFGGRADTIESKKKYKVLYEQDANGFYPYCSLLTIDPSETPGGFGNAKRPLVDISILDRFFSYYVYAHVTIPIGIKQSRFGPLVVRNNSGDLEYPTTPGKTLDGWWWKHELDDAREAGWEVTIYKGYGWEKSSNWLEQWVRNMWELRQTTSGKVKDIIKKETNAAIGRFGMEPETLTLIDEEDRQDGDLPYIIEDAGRWDTSITRLAIHVEPQIDANHLTHIYSYILSRARCVLRDKLLAEELAGTEPILSNYDSVYTKREPVPSLTTGLGIGQWKTLIIDEATIHAPRSVSGKYRDGAYFSKRPGVRKDSRLRVKDVHAPHPP